MFQYKVTKGGNIAAVNEDAFYYLSADMKKILRWGDDDYSHNEADFIRGWSQPWAGTISQDQIDYMVKMWWAEVESRNWEPIYLVYTGEERGYYILNDCDLYATISSDDYDRDYYPEQFRSFTIVNKTFVDDVIDPCKAFGNYVYRIEEDEDIYVSKMPCWDAAKRDPEKEKCVSFIRQWLLVDDYDFFQPDLVEVAEKAAANNVCSLKELVEIGGWEKSIKKLVPNHFPETAEQLEEFSLVINSWEISAGELLPYQTWPLGRALLRDHATKEFRAFWDQNKGRTTTLSSPYKEDAEIMAIITACPKMALEGKVKIACRFIGADQYTRLDVPSERAAEILKGLHYHCMEGTGFRAVLRGIESAFSDAGIEFKPEYNPSVKEVITNFEACPSKWDGPSLD